MLERDVVLSKISIIKNCLNTISKVTGLNPEKLDDMIVQDVFVLNLQRAVQAVIDIAHIYIAIHGWKLPASYKESFSILEQNGMLDLELARTMQRMCGFRNIAIHNYQELNPDILKTILSRHLKDFEAFYSLILAKLPE